MQLSNVLLAYFLVGLIVPIIMSGCSTLNCQRYVTKSQTLSIGAIKGQINAISKVDVNDVKFNNDAPKVSDDIVQRDQAQYQACVAIDRMPDSPAKTERQNKYVDDLLDILKQTAAQNSGAVSVSSKPGIAVQPIAPKVTKIDIAQPIVNQPRVSYPQVKLRTGQTIVITAGGCVQTGGHGKTWKRYVDPDPSDKYFATITVPGIYNDKPLREVVGKPFFVPAAAEGQDLVLGYVDDNYDDNGYYAHDDGTNNQCQGIGPASVTVLVT